MATNTYVALDTKTLSSTATVTFTSIPQTYTDLILVLGSLTFSSGGNPQIQFNGDTSTNYSNTDMYGTGSVTNTTRNTNNNYINIGFSATNGSATDPSIVTMHVQNYANATMYKSIIARGSRAGGEVQTNVGLWRGTPAAITSMTVKVASGAMTGTATLYGVATAGVTPAPKATGGAIYDDSLYYYHVFGQTGVFTPSTSLSCDYVIVAGGGGSGYGTGGGGGAGGFRSFTSQTLSATNYPVTIGGGGSGSSSANNAGGDGTNSSFNSLTSTGGGGGGSQPGSGAGSNGRAGGSGGGASRSGSSYSGGAGNLGGYTPVEGFGGGNNQTAATNGCGGGGGAGGAGVSGTTTADGAGGIGATSALVTAIVSATGVGQLVSGVGYLAGGGGGGGAASGTKNGAAGGLGGGANGGAELSVGNNGTISTGGGAGGAGYLNGGSGGSGVVIVRYLKV
jgi:hypothetical protein